MTLDFIGLPTVLIPMKMIGQEEPDISFLDESMENLAGETFNMALFDSGCTKPVCDEQWQNVFVNILSLRDVSGIIPEKSNTMSYTVYISSLVQRGDAWNEKVKQANLILVKKCHDSKLPFINNNNINPTYYVNRSNLHLNYKGTRLLANNFFINLGFWLNYHTFNNGPSKIISENYETIDPVNIDVTVNVDLDVDVDVEVDVDVDAATALKSLRLSNLNRLIVGYLNINSVRNKLEAVNEIISRNLDILTITETKIDSSFPTQQFEIDGYSTALRLDRN